MIKKLRNWFKAVIYDPINDRQLELTDNSNVPSELRFLQEPDNTIREATTQYPFPVSDGMACASDIWVSESNMGDFSGSVTDLFDNLHSVISNTTSNNPKEIVVHFSTTAVTNAIGLGAFATGGGTFSNLEIQVSGSDVTWVTVVDESADSTVKQSETYPLPITFGFNAIKLRFHTTNTITISNLVIPTSKSVIARIQAAKDDGTVTDIKATRYDNLHVSIQEYGDTPAIDAFARLRVSENFTIFDSKQLHDKQPLFWDESLGGSATSVHSSTDSNVAMTVTASASDYVIRQTKQRFNYQPGKSQLIFMTFYSPQVAGITSRVGIFDGTGANYLTPNNGIFFECDGTLSWNIAKNGTTTETVSQSSWNMDKLDGTGASGITLDMSATQILVVDFEWLGVGRVRTGFVIDGLIYYCHFFNHSNDSSYTSVYMSTPNLPLRYSIETTGTNGSTLDHICSTVISEGGTQKTGVLRSVDNGTSYVTSLTTGTEYALIGIRLKSAYLDVSVIPESISIVVGTNDDFRWRLLLNPTIAGTFTYADKTNSSVQTATGAAANTVTGGTDIASGYGSKASKQTQADLQTALRIGSTIAGVQDELVLCISPISANLSIITALNFRELL